MFQSKFSTKLSNQCAGFSLPFYAQTGTSNTYQNLYLSQNRLATVLIERGRGGQLVGGWLVAGMAASNDRRDILLVVGKKRRRSEREERERCVARFLSLSQQIESRLREAEAGGGDRLEREKERERKRHTLSSTSPFE